MSNNHRTVVLRRLLDAAIAISLLAILLVLLTEGFQTTLLGVPVSLTHLSNPLLVFLSLLLLRIAATAGWKSALLLTGSITSGLLMLEAGARVVAYLAPGGGEGQLHHRGEASRPTALVGETKGGILRRSADPALIYELVPARETTFRGQPVTINRYGFRGRAHAPQPKGDAIRIVGLGDSVMFGWGVSDGETYLDQLAWRLAAAYPEDRWQIINSAVPGYNTCMEVTSLESRLLEYGPDLVVIGFVGNDLDLPNYVLERMPVLTLQRSFFLMFLESRLKRLAWEPRHRLTVAPVDPFRPEAFESNPERVPREYRHLVGIDAYRRCMSELRRLGTAHGFDVVVFSTGALAPDVEAVCRELGFAVLDARLWEWGQAHRKAVDRGNPAVAEAQRQVDAYLLATGIPRYLASSLAVSEEDPHPSALGHEALAIGLFAYLETSGLLDALRHAERATAAPRPPLRP